MNRSGSTTFKLSLAGALVLSLAACGGGGGGNSGFVGSAAAPASSTKESSLQLAGTAATGAALASASVAVKCASGEGTATTDANGAYTLKLTGGALPCVIKVTGTQGGVEVTLHSLTEAGSADASTGVTSAAANVTPLTELVVAQLTAGLPADFFSAFSGSSGAQISTEKLVAATQAVLTALKDATGIDLGDIDPFKTKLVAATSSTPDGGNAYDKLLDQLGDKVSVEALPQIVTQIAAAAASGSTTGLGEAMASVENGSLAGCPVAVSGKYRNLDYFGRISVRDVNFKTMKVSAQDGTPLYDITADAAKPCEFTVAGTANGTTVKLDMVMGPSGIAAFTIDNQTSGKTSIGYLIPVQSHPLSALTGDWTYLQSGYSGPQASYVNYPGKFDIKADGNITACDYDYGGADFSVCLPNSATRVLAARTDGGFDLVKNGTVAARVYGYRTPDGTLTLFGTQNPDGVGDDPTVMQTTMLLSQMKTLSMPAVGNVSNYWDVALSQNNGVRTVSISPNSTTITAVDGDLATRSRASDGRVDTVRYNQPVAGFRYRAAGTNFGATYQLPMRGAGFTVHISGMPGGPGQQSYSVSMNRK